MSKIKENRKQFSIFTTTDGKKFTDEQRSVAKKEAEEHQKELDFKALQEVTSKRLWIKFGLPIQYYDRQFQPWNLDEDHKKEYHQCCEEVEKIFEEANNVFYEGLDTDPPETWDEFINLLFEKITKHHTFFSNILTIINSLEVECEE